MKSVVLGVKKSQARKETAILKADWEKEDDYRVLIDLWVLTVWKSLVALIGVLQMCVRGQRPERSGYQQIWDF